MRLASLSSLAVNTFLIASALRSPIRLIKLMIFNQPPADLKSTPPRVSFPCKPIDLKTLNRIKQRTGKAMDTLFAALGRFAVRYRYLVVVAWIGITITSVLVFPSLSSEKAGIIFSTHPHLEQIS